ncbi:MAG: flagellar hook capping FlgD N-terminal domain-containing protein [Alphaproteobacteria bacterium]|nr:flagellar hook capping FlgD N-terminal domain-containing protein [Alphaproteobacteria bacterium]
MTVASTTDATSLISSYNATQTSTETTTSSAQSVLIGNYDTFLKILTAQLTNQDPTEPVDASEFTQQLVQYSQVEQQIATNDKLDDVLSALNSNGITPLLSYIGQYTESSTTDELVVQNGTGLLSYTLPSDAQSVTLSVQDSSGNVIGTVDAPTDAGLNRIAWDAGLDDGTTAEDGVYNFLLTAKDSSGDTITISDIRVIGQVTSIETGTDGTSTLKVGDLSVSDTDVLSVFGAISTTDSSTTTT